MPSIIHKLTLRTTGGWEWCEHIHDDDLNPDTMTDLFAYYDFLFEGDEEDYEIIDSEILNVKGRKKPFARWTNFVAKYGLLGQNFPHL